MSRESFKGLDIISNFYGEYSFLSNFHPSVITVSWDGEEFQAPTVEHAFQASKMITTLNFKSIIEAKHPAEAKKLGRNLRKRPDWDMIKVDVMTELTRKKFQIPELKSLLLQTGNKLLIEGNNWGDMFWGMTQEGGENWLGKILMDVRKELR